MPRLAKGGKWVFGWVVVDADRRIRIPQDAWNEYGFHVGQEAVLIRGSRASGGFGLATDASVAGPIGRRAFARTRFESGRVVALPREAEIEPWQRLLAVRGSGHALGFIALGPLFERALKYPSMPQSLP